MAEEFMRTLVMFLGLRSEEILKSFDHLDADQLILMVLDDKNEKRQSALEHLRENLGVKLHETKVSSEKTSAVFDKTYEMLERMNKDNVIIDLTAGLREACFGLFLAASVLNIEVGMFNMFDEDSFERLPKVLIEPPNNDYFEILEKVKELEPVGVKTLLKENVLDTKFVDYTKDFNEYMKNSKKVIYYLKGLEERGFLELKKNGKELVAKTTFLGKKILKMARKNSNLEKLSTQ